MKEEAQKNTTNAPIKSYGDDPENPPIPKSDRPGAKDGSLPPALRRQQQDS